MRRRGARILGRGRAIDAEIRAGRRSARTGNRLSGTR